MISNKKKNMRTYCSYGDLDHIQYYHFIFWTLFVLFIDFACIAKSTKIEKLSYDRVR